MAGTPYPRRSSRVPDLPATRPAGRYGYSVRAAARESEGRPVSRGWRASVEASNWLSRAPAARRPRRYAGMVLVPLVPSRHLGSPRVAISALGPLHSTRVLPLRERPAPISVSNHLIRKHWVGAPWDLHGRPISYKTAIGTGSGYLGSKVP